MQLFIILMLVTVPIIFVQFYSADSRALLYGEDETHEPAVESLFEQISDPESGALKSGLRKAVVKKSEVAMLQNEPLQNESFLRDDEMGAEMEAATSQTGDIQIETTFENAALVPPVKHKKIRLVKGRRQVQGMDFLSVLLMLKDRKR